MPELNKERIFTESPTKVLIREYNKMKQDYSKLSAMEYATLYENAPLSFILENSRYIFSEPFKGYEFYKTIIESSVLPFHKMEDELVKVESYLTENVKNMSEAQLNMYNELHTSVETMVENNRRSISLYEATMENPDGSMKYYDALYEYQNTYNDDALFILEGMVEDQFLESVNIMDTLHILPHIEEMSSTLYNYMEDVYTESPATPQEYSVNSFITNTLTRMLQDKAILESVNSLPNVNTRHTILGLAGVETSDVLDGIVEEKVVNYDPIYSTAEDSVNRLFEDDVYSEAMEEIFGEEKLNRLLCEKAVVDMDLAFLYTDSLTDTPIRNSIVEKLCIESTSIEKIPEDVEGQIEILEREQYMMDKEIMYLQERYFQPDGSPGRVVASTIGASAKDTVLSKEPKKEEDDSSVKDAVDKVFTPEVMKYKSDEDDKKDDNKDEKDDKKEDKEKKKEDTIAKYSSFKDTKEDDKKDSDEEDEEDEKDDDEYSSDDEDDEEDEEDVKKREEAKRKKTEKYANMDIDEDEFKSVTEADEDEYDDVKPAKPEKPSKDEPEKKKGLFNREKKEKPVKVEKPEKRPLSQRIQNKALDADVKFKMGVANAKRKAVDTKNAIKASVKIPMNVTTTVKKQVNEWDEMDDDKRKEYIMKPGYRKKYFKALKLCIIHYGAFAINPVLNIVLFICQKVGSTKDVRIRNELIRELQAEIKVTEQKIEDAKQNGETQKTYKLMRIREKLDAELARISSNSKYI